jgi:hypothetical protein
VVSWPEGHSGGNRENGNGNERRKARSKLENRDAKTSAVIGVTRLCVPNRARGSRTGCCSTWNTREEARFTLRGSRTIIHRFRGVSAPSFRSFPREFRLCAILENGKEKNGTADPRAMLRFPRDRNSADSKVGNRNSKPESRLWPTAFGPDPTRRRRFRPRAGRGTSLGVMSYETF